MSGYVLQILFWVHCEDEVGIIDVIDGENEITCSSIQTDFNFGISLDICAGKESFLKKCKLSCGRCPISNCADISGTWISSPVNQASLIIHQFQIVMTNCTGYFIEISHGTINRGKSGVLYLIGDEIYSGEQPELRLGTVKESGASIYWDFGYISKRKTERILFNIACVEELFFHLSLPLRRH